MAREFFDECQLGDCFVSTGRTITETDVVMFAAMTGDWQSIHTDAEYARRTPFGERIAHGLLSLVTAGGLLFRSVGDFLPRRLIALTNLDRVRFVGPVKLGDTIRMEVEISGLKPMSPERGLIDLSFRIKNQHDAVVLTGRLKAAVERSPGGARLDTAEPQPK